MATCVIGFRKRVLICIVASLMPALAFAGEGARATSSTSGDWRSKLQQELPLLGHRNWIAVVDSAYPLQTSAGIETIETDSEHLEVVRVVFEELGKAKHIR